jgi:hypothetical protein
MSWQGMEAVVTAAVAALKAGLSDVVDDVNENVTDGILISAPHSSSYLVGISMDELESGTLQLASPSVIVQGPGATPSPNRGQPDTGGEYAADNEFSVSVLFQAPTLVERVYLAWRYQVAVISVLCADGALAMASGDVASASWRGDGYLERTIPSGVWRDAVTLFSVITFETP